jgi:hypothetical protein
VHGKGAAARQHSVRTAKIFAVQFGQAHGNVAFAVDVIAVCGRTAKPLPGKIGSLPCDLSHGNDDFSRSGYSSTKRDFKLSTIPDTSVTNLKNAKSRS